MRDDKSQTVDYFIDNRVDDMLSRSVAEGKKRKPFEKRDRKKTPGPALSDGLDFISAFSEFSDFPRFNGRGVQNSSYNVDSGSLVLWLTDVDKNDVEDYIASIVNAGFLKNDADFIKEKGNEKLVISINYSGSKLRIYYTKMPV